MKLNYHKKHQDNIRGEKWTEIFSDMYYFSNLTQQDAEQFFDIMSDADIEISEHRYKYFDKLSGLRLEFKAYSC